MADAKNPLERELAFYEQHKGEWLPHYENQFVVVAGNKVAGFYKDYESAWDAGAREFGPEATFLIKQVCLHDPVYFLY
jgi:hypothetical protein